MDKTLAFRMGLAARILRASAVALPVAAIGAFGACGTGGTGGAGTGGAGGAGTTGTTTQTKQACFAWPEPDAGTPDGGGADAGVVCPDKTQAPMYLGSQLQACNQVVSQGTFDGTQCCYTIQLNTCLGTGRPFLDGGRARTAPARRGVWAEGSQAPDMAALPAAVRARLAAAWAADGLLEHASIASFGRFAFELLAVGAPADLVAEAHRAALDEIEHARLCLGLAGAYGAEPVAPAPFPFEGRVEVSADLASIAARAAREGCIGETLGAVQAAEQLAGAEDPGVLDALARIVEDESRHAELSWRFVAWALAQGGAEVREAVARAFAEGLAQGVTIPDQGEAHPREMSAHGRVDPAALRAALSRALDDVVRPCAGRLLAA
jgi:hypothetical protein